jgi:hypothetical protein
MFAESAEALQAMLGILEEYCRKWRFEVNVGKSKVMVCRPSAQVANEKVAMVFASKPMQQVNEYKYVGVIVTDIGDWKAHIAYVADKARKVSMSLYRSIFSHFGLSVRVKVEVWNTMVASILRYGSEVWWTQVVEARQLEAIQLGAMKDIMRINGSTTTAFMRGDLALAELSRDRDRALLTWAGRIACRGAERWPRIRA